MVWLNGYGFPLDKGGLMFFADSIGAPAILTKMQALSVEDDAFKPAILLEMLAETGDRFIDIDTGGLKTGPS